MPRTWLAALALLVAGCARPPPPALPIALGPYTYEAREELFATVLRSVTEAGYQVSAAPASEGRIVAPARTRVREGQPDLTVQLYQEGWVSVYVFLPEHRGLALRLTNEAERLALRIRDDLAAQGYTPGGAP